MVSRSLSALVPAASIRPLASPADDVQDCEVGCAVERVDLRPNGLAQCLQNRLRDLDRPSDDFTHHLWGCPLGCCGAAVSFEPIEIKHDYDLLPLPHNAN